MFTNTRPCLVHKYNEPFYLILIYFDSLVVSRPETMAILYITSNILQYFADVEVVVISSSSNKLNLK